MKSLLPSLLVLLAPYAIEARHDTNEGPSESPSPVMSGPKSDRFIVRYKNEHGKSSVHKAAKKVRHADLGPHHNAIAVELSSEAMESLQNDSNIESIEEDPPRYATMLRGYHSNDIFNEVMHDSNKGTHGKNHRKLLETVPYGIPMVQADQVSYDSSNPRTICIIDSGYNLGHEDLPSSNVTGYDGSFWNGDFSGHGTHVAGRYLSTILGV